MRRCDFGVPGLPLARRAPRLPVARFVHGRRGAVAVVDGGPARRALVLVPDPRAHLGLHRLARDLAHRRRELERLRGPAGGHGRRRGRLPLQRHCAVRVVHERVPVEP